jgi:hypothetical protein
MNDPTCSQTDANSLASDEQDSFQSREKKSLEIQVLARQLSSKYEAREWLKAATPILGLLALIWTIYVGIGQLNQSIATRKQENFETAVNRTDSKEPGERLTGIATLSSLLKVSTRERIQDILNVLVNATAVEDDVIVRGALLDTFRELDAKQIGPELLYATLLRVVSRNRALKVAGGVALVYPSSPKLKALGMAMVELMRKGAYVQDLSETYCSECDFSKLDLHGVSFKDSILNLAFFKEANLSEADFFGAWIGSAVFYKANLRKARFSHNDMLASDHFSVYPAGIGFPIFDCADLSGADFNYYAIAVVWVHDDKKVDSQPLLDISNADVTGADFSSSIILFMEGVHAIKQAPYHTFKLSLAHGIGPSGGLPPNWTPGMNERKAIMKEFGRSLPYARGWREAKLPIWLRDALSSSRDGDPGPCLEVRRYGWWK